MFLNSFYIINIIKKPAANTVLKTIFAFYSIDNTSLKLPWAALKYCRIGDSCAVPRTLFVLQLACVTFACTMVTFLSWLTSDVNKERKSCELRVYQRKTDWEERIE